MSSRVSGFNADQTKYNGFACRCGDAKKKEMASLHDWVIATFYDKYQPKSDFYVTQLLYTLAGTYEAWVESIPLDPGGWGAVVVETDKSDKTPLHTYIQFDRLEDGLALTIKAFHEKYGRQRHDEGDDEEAESS